jgi:hypothetical protein
LENVFSAEKLNQLFHDHARQQREGELLFSTVVDLMGLVVAGQTHTKSLSGQGLATGTRDSSLPFGDA